LEIDLKIREEPTGQIGHLELEHPVAGSEVAGWEGLGCGGHQALSPIVHKGDEFIERPAVWFPDKTGGLHRPECTCKLLCRALLDALQVCPCWIVEVGSRKASPSPRPSARSGLFNGTSGGDHQVVLLASPCVDGIARCLSIDPGHGVIPNDGYFQGCTRGLARYKPGLKRVLIARIGRHRPSWLSYEDCGAKGSVELTAEREDPISQPGRFDSDDEHCLSLDNHVGG
jgi:hypothetical protein